MKFKKTVNRHSDKFVSYEAKKEYVRFLITTFDGGDTYTLTISDTRKDILGRMLPRTLYRETGIQSLEEAKNKAMNYELLQ